VDGSRRKVKKRENLLCVLRAVCRQNAANVKLMLVGRRLFAFRGLRVLNFLQSGLSVIGKLSVIIILLGAFLFGLGGTLFMALRSPEVKVPEVVGKDFLAAEKELEAGGLKLRKRTDRFSQEKPNTILEQSPLAGDLVKAGQTVSVVIARAEAESGEKAAEVKKENVNTAPKVDEPSEVDKARQKRKAANKNANANKNKNDNGNAGNLNANGNSNSNSATNSNGGGTGSNGNSNAANRTNVNARNANSGGATNLNSRTPNANARNANSVNRSNSSGNRGAGTNQRNQ
jgi:hypothetical protein